MDSFVHAETLNCVDSLHSSLHVVIGYKKRYMSYHAEMDGENSSKGSEDKEDKNEDKEDKKGCFVAAKTSVVFT